MATQPTQPLGLPVPLNPDALDTLSDLASLLTRLRSSQNQPGVSSSQSNTLTQSTTTTNTLSTLSSSAAPTGPPIALKDLPSQSDQLRHRFQKARALVKTLPDMERTTEEQEAEMVVLEDKIRRQRETLEKLKSLGAQFSTDHGDRMEE